MATANRTEATVLKVVQRVTLNLSEEEADFLLAILSAIGGHPATSPRKHQEAVYKALRDALGYDFERTAARPLLSGYLMFSNYPPGS